MKARKTHKGSIGLLLDGISTISVLKKLVPDSIKKIAGLFPDKGCRKNSMTDGFPFISAKGTKSSSFQSRNIKRGVSIYTILNNLYSHTKILNLFYFSKTFSLSLLIPKTKQR